MKKYSRKIKILACLCLVFTLFALLPAPRAEAALYDKEKIASPYAAVYNVENDMFVFEKDADALISPSVTAKIMTALLALEHFPDLTVSVAVTSESLSGITLDKFRIGISTKHDTKITVEDLIYTMLVGNCTDSAAVLSYAIGGSHGAFSKMMNAKAAELGLESTVYNNATGLGGDILHYLAGMYDEPRQIRDQEYVIKISRKDYPLIEQMALSNRYFFTDFEKHKDEPAVSFLKEFNRIIEMEALMSQVNDLREEYRSLRAIPDLRLKKVINDYHRNLNAKANEIYEYLIAEGLSNPRWKSEQKAYAIVRSHYEDAKFQYQPDFLFGQRIDIFIPSLNIAIEYQGKQHYSPVDFFGGQDGQRRNAARDMRKLRRCRAHGIEIIYWDYDKPLDDEYFVNEIMAKFPKKDAESCE
jgi:hypothetical protein